MDSARTQGIDAYSKDLRLRVLDAVDRGLPRKEVANIFGVSLSPIKRYVKRRRAAEGLEPRRGTSGASDHLVGEVGAVDSDKGGHPQLLHLPRTRDAMGSFTMQTALTQRASYSPAWFHSKPFDAEVLTIEMVGIFLNTDKCIHLVFRCHYAERFPALHEVHCTTFSPQAANL